MPDQTAAERAAEVLRVEPTPDPNARFYCAECDRYFAAARGLASHRGRVHSASKSCPTCGVIVGNQNTHDAWHRAMASVAADAQRASIYSNVIGVRHA